MAARSIWKGSISFSLLSIPVRVYPATSSKDVSFNTLHAGCGARIKQQNICSVHGNVLTTEDTERGFEATKGSYVTVTDDDLSGLVLPSLRTIKLDQFVQASEIDPVYFEKAYWLDADPIGVRPYALLYQALLERGLVGIGTVTLRTRERLCALRTGGGTLVLSTLFYPDEIRERALEPAPPVSAPELDLALNLVDTLTSPFNPAEHTDVYRAALLDLIAAKQTGAPIAAAAADTTKPVGDLMAMLQAAVKDAKTKPDAINPRRKGEAA